MISASNSWTVCVSSDVELNFLVYVARAYSICDEYFDKHGAWPNRQVSLSDQLHHELETQWQDFWNGSIQLKAEAKIQQKAALESQAPDLAVSHPMCAQLNHNHVSPFVLDQPYFEAIQHRGLREALAAQWPSFIQWWNMPAGGQAAMQYWEHIPDLIRYVREFEIEAGRPIQSFHLDVELIYNGPCKPIEVTDEYVIMPIRTDYLMKPDWWNERFKERY
ncbi:hypothetical protein [Paenibacillus silvae]|uniref:Uncharacterized protein n=1 Tax=Paenibacillus silvae TaxID=1325358 RepID=A0A2W6NB86_9BACL|nr:hypothetical protein [Paenibacillus silvae]PZT53234.1 hypothetical protein DN757_23245 [Paenibacillus silvae]